MLEKVHAHRSAQNAAATISGGRFCRLAGELVEIDAAVGSAMFLDAELVQTDVTCDRAGLTSLLEHAARTFDRAPIDDPGLAGAKLRQEARSLSANASQTRHLGMAEYFQVSSQIVGELASERAP